MPTYDYRCSDCLDGEQFEQFRSFDEFARRIACPFCGGDAWLVISPPRIQKSSLRHEATFDHSLGTVVTGQRDREEVAKRLEQKDGRKIAFVDPQDTKALGVNDDGLDATRRRKRDTGQAEGTSKTFAI